MRKNIKIKLNKLEKTKKINLFKNKIKKEEKIINNKELSKIINADYYCNLNGIEKERYLYELFKVFLNSQNKPIIESKEKLDG